MTENFVYWDFGIKKAEYVGSDGSSDFEVYVEREDGKKYSVLTRLDFINAGVVLIHVENESEVRIPFVPVPENKDFEIQDFEPFYICDDPIAWLIVLRMFPPFEWKAGKHSLEVPSRECALSARNKFLQTSKAEFVGDRISKFRKDNPGL
jgi:hypothetical protein